MALTNLRINFVRRNWRKNGPAYSSTINDSFDELSTDLQNLSTQWNDSLIPLISALPTGAAEDGVTEILDAFTDGLDGSTLYTEAGATATTDSKFYNPTQTRPNSVKEQFEELYDYVDESVNGISDDIQNQAGALTEAQKSRIGSNIFDTSKISLTTSLDGVSAANADNVNQIAQDLYGDTFTLLGDGDATLTYSVQEQVDALLQLHGGAWDSDITLTHSGVVVDHALCTNLNSTTYTHLSATQAIDLTDGGASTLHYHTSDRDSANWTGTNAVDLTDGGDSTLHYHASDRDSSNFSGVNWTDLTDGGNTTLHAHSQYAAITQEAWHGIGDGGEPAFENGWRNYPTGEPARFYKDTLGIVHLSGEVMSGVHDSTMFTLPSGYRPLYLQNLACMWGTRMRVTTSGTVRIDWDDLSWVSFQGVEFPLT
jgi:hypothetical protein